MATETIDGTATEIEAESFAIPAGRRFIAIVWDDDGATARVHCANISHEAAFVALVRAGLQVRDDGMAGVVSGSDK